MSFGSFAAIHGQVIDLAALEVGKGIQIKGAGQQGRLGFSSSGVGDFNGDGRPDVVAGAPAAGGGSGEVFLIFGTASLAEVNAGNLSGAGLRLGGGAGQDFLGFSVAGAGDFNGDGFDDVIAGAPASNAGLGGATIFLGNGSGTGAPATVSITGARLGDVTGFSVSGAGDVNGDGLADVIIGAPQQQGAAPAGTGRAFVVFGTRETSVISLGNLGDQGFEIRGIATFDQLGGTVAGAGDVNGDGLADLILCAPARDAERGESYVVFGRKESTLVDLATLGGGGFAIGGLDPFMALGSGGGAAAAGDVNGDGLADVILGAQISPSVDVTGISPEGEAYVVFGKRGAGRVDLKSLGSAGFKMDGLDGSTGTTTRFGAAVAGAGDVNGDGFMDLIVGATVGGFFEGGADRSQGGTCYVIFGSAGNADVSMDTLGSRGFTLLGAGVGGNVGRSVSAAGDVDGDGLADVLAGADREPLQTQAGEAYVVFSPVSAPPQTASYKFFAPPGDAPRIAAGAVGDGSDASTPAARMWIDFEGGDDESGAASLQTVTIERSNARIANLAGAIPLLWEVQTNRTNPAAVITVKYLDSEVFQTSEESLRLFTASNPQGPWTPLTTGVVRDANRNLLTARTNSAGFFAIGSDVDSDGDGLPDEWEREGGGIDFDGDGTIDVSLFALGARPDRKDLFLEIDSTLDQVVSDAAIAMLVAAFDEAPVSNPDGSTGITLHIDNTERGIQTDFSQPMGFTALTGNRQWPINFALLKSQHFGSPGDRADENRDNILGARGLFTRYCLVFGTTTTGEAGQAERSPGDDFYVCLFIRNLEEDATKRDEMVASVIMHELGHTLGLRHGGDQDIFNKPNYPSIMNYAYHFNYKYFRDETEWSLDFARAALPPLFEENIDETIGINGGAFYRNYVMPVGVAETDPADPQSTIRATKLIRLDGRPFDIGNPTTANGKPDGQSTTGVSQDLNHFPLNGPALGAFPSQGEVYTGFNDWANIVYRVKQDSEAGERGNGGPDGLEELPFAEFYEFYNGIPPLARPAESTGWLMD